MRLCLRCKSTEAIVNTREICVDALPWLGHDRSPEYFGAVTVLLILSTLAVVLRFLARSIARSSYGYDDWIMLFALVCDLFEFGETGQRLTQAGLGIRLVHLFVLLWVLPSRKGLLFR